MSDYGLTTPDVDSFQYDYGDNVVQIQLRPPTLDEFAEYEQLGEDTSAARLKEIIDEHIVKPEKSAGDMTMREVNCYIEGIVRYGNEGGDLRDDVLDEIEARQAGNEAET